MIKIAFKIMVMIEFKMVWKRRRVGMDLYVFGFMVMIGIWGFGMQMGWMVVVVVTAANRAQRRARARTMRVPERMQLNRREKIGYGMKRKIDDAL